MLLFLVVTFVFIVFVTIPSGIPSLSESNSSILLKGCKKNSIQPIYYHTYIWDKPTEPTFSNENPFTTDEEGNIIIDQEKLRQNSGLGGKLLVEPSVENMTGYTISGYLLYFSGTKTLSAVSRNFLVWMGGLNHRTLDITIQRKNDGETITTKSELSTGDNGYFHFTIDFPERPDCFSIIVGYKGDEFPAAQVTYFPCNIVYSTCEPDINASDEKNNYRALVTGIGIFIGLTAITLVLLRRRRPNDEIESAHDTIEIPQELEKMIPIEEFSEEPFDKTILFPEIESSLPSVWGNGELLQVMFNRKDEESNVELRIEWGDDNEPETAPSAQGRRILTHMFTLPGEYVIKAGYQDKSGKEFSSWRKIRIVDYREEMVRLFGEMLEELNLEDREITRDLTPREVERLLSERLKNVSKESLRRVIDGFEEANYSTHPVNRESYVRMYRAIREVRGKG
jgi:hypothetical protein